MAVIVITVDPADKAFFPLKLHADESNGSTHWKMTHKPCLHVKSAYNCNTLSFALTGMCLSDLLLLYDM